MQGMKVHDCHISMQDLLILTYRGVLDEKVLESLAVPSLFFKQLCSETLKVENLRKWRKTL